VFLPPLISADFPLCRAKKRWPPTAIDHASDGKVGNGVAEWGKVGYGGDTQTTGVAGLLPLRHSGLNSLPGTCALAFRGHFEHSLDVKNRLSIPARFRAAFSSGTVLAKDFEPCVAVYTAEAHEAIVERALGPLNPMGQDYRKLSRYFQGNSFDTELDASGRVILPAPLLDHTGIQKEVVVVGVGDHLEVWARERWQQQQDALDSEIGEVTERLGNPS
jgi:transcriptional regulator MraZ